MAIRGRKPKYQYIVKINCVNAKKLYKEYKDSLLNIGNRKFTEIGEINFENDITYIDDIYNKEPDNNYYDTNNDKIITMIDHVNYNCLPGHTDLKCAHDGHQFVTSPIGIPIEYIKKDEKRKLNDYFLTYRVVCSWPCALSFINNNKHKLMYRNSKSLLYSMYYKIYNKELVDKSAPDSECLIENGGHLDIKNFRDSFCKTKYIITENIRRPYMISVGKYIEENNNII